MSKKEKLIKRLKSIPRDFTFEEMDALLSSLGFIKSNKGKTSGSRIMFVRESKKIDVHKPHPRKEFLAYQIHKIIRALEKEGLI